MAYPDSPSNVFVTHPYILGNLDIRWDDASFLAANVHRKLLGYNVYRSYDTPNGPFQKLTPIPVGTLFYRDSHTIQQAVNEIPMVLSSGSTAPGKFVLLAQNKPLIKPKARTVYKNTFNSVSVLASSREDVTVLVNGVQQPVDKIVANTGEIILLTDRCFDPKTEKFIDHSVPDGALIQISYFYTVNTVITRLNQRIYYKVTTVDLAGLETPLANTPSFTFQETEHLDFMWQEAIRRSKWILEQAGEPAKLFIRKYVGQPCPNTDPNRRHTLNDCPLCYGTGIVGGYEGPVDILLAPPDQQKALSLGDLGIKVAQANTTWMLPTPFVTQRDFVVKQNGERHGFGPVSTPTIRGAPLLQFFETSLRNDKDIIYRVPLVGSENIPSDQTAAPDINEPKPNVPAGQQLKGRTKKFGVINH